jgi:ABC-type multidrug transport system fused ATPase/permease subunit
MTFKNNIKFAYIIIRPFTYLFLVGLLFGSLCSYLDTKIHKEVSLLITCQIDTEVYTRIQNIIAITFFTGLFGAIRGGIFTYVNTLIYENVITKIFFNIKSASMYEWDTIFKAEELSKCLLGDISHVIETLCFLFNASFRSLTSLLYVSYILYNLSFNILCLCLGLSICHVYIFHNLHPFHGKYIEITNKNKLNLEKHMNEYILKYNGILLYSWQDFYYNVFENNLKIFKNNVPSQSIVYGIITFLTHIICKYGEIIIIAFLLHEKKEIPVIIEIISYYSILTNTINTLKDVSLNTIKSKEQIERVWNIYTLNIKDNKDLSYIILENKYSIEFNNISFSYPSDNTLIFNNFSLKINEREHIALIAKSGSGKTTLFKLLLNQYELKTGEILINNCNVQNIPKNVLNKLINIVPQEHVFFNNLSLFENIVMGNNNISKENIKTILDKVQLSNFINKIDEPLIELSGGQKQRLAIARILINNCPIIILDEPTSSLDIETTSLIMDTLKDYMADKIVIIITHNHSIITDSMKKIFL